MAVAAEEEAAAEEAAAAQCLSATAGRARPADGRYVAPGAPTCAMSASRRWAEEYVSVLLPGSEKRARCRAGGQPEPERLRSAGVLRGAAGAAGGLAQRLPAAGARLRRLRRPVDGGGHFDARVAGRPAPVPGVVRLRAGRAAAAGLARCASASAGRRAAAAGAARPRRPAAGHGRALAAGLGRAAAAGDTPALPAGGRRRRSRALAACAALCGAL